MMQEQPSGSMLSVRRPASEIEARLTGDLVIASDNAPALCVVAGPSEQVAAFERDLAQADVPCRLLVTSHAFHSAMMDPVVEPFRKLVEAVALREPEIPFVSTATGDFITKELATDPSYWARHLRLRVRFAEAVKALLDQPNLALLEVGPRATLATLARQQIKDKAAQICLSSLGDSDESTWSSLLLAAGQLWTLGVELHPRELHGPGLRRRVPLPTYPFERKRFWIDRASPVPAAGAVASPTNGAGHAFDAEGDGVSELIARQIAVMAQQIALLETLPAEEDAS
jgi:acyl transferase domain-containing protein